MSLEKNGIDKKFPVVLVYKRVVPADLLEHEITTAKKYFLDLLKEEKKASEIAQSSLGQQIEQLLQRIDKSIEEEEFDTEPIKELQKLPVVETERNRVAETLLRFIQSTRNTGQSSFTLHVLAKWGTNKQVPALLKELELAENFYVSSVTYALEKLGGPEIVDPLLERLHNIDDGTFSRSAIDGIADALSIHGPSIEEKILPLLNHENEDIVEAACDILIKCGTEKSVQAISELLASAPKNASYRDEAKWALRRLQRKDRPTKNRSNKVPKPSAKKLMVSSETNLEEKRLQDAIAKLQEIGQKKRGDPASSLAAIAKTPLMEKYRAQVAPLLVEQLKRTKRPNNIKYAISALATWGGPKEAKAVERLLDFAKQKSTQRLIFQTLGKIGDAGVTKRMLPYLKSSNYGYLAVQAFGNSSVEVEDKLVELLSSKNVYLRARAAALGYSSTERAEEALLVFLEDEPDSLAREQAIYGLGRMRANFEQQNEGIEKPNE